MTRKLLELSAILIEGVAYCLSWLVLAYFLMLIYFYSRLPMWNTFFFFFFTDTGEDIRDTVFFFFFLRSL